MTESHGGGWGGGAGRFSQRLNLCKFFLECPLAVQFPSGLSAKDDMSGTFWFCKKENANFGNINLLYMITHFLRQFVELQMWASVDCNIISCLFTFVQSSTGSVTVILQSQPVTADCKVRSDRQMSPPTNIMSTMICETLVQIT